MSRRVEHDPAYQPVVAQVGHVCVEMAPFAEAVRHEERDLVQSALGTRRRDRSPVVGVHEVDEARAEQLLLGPADHVGDRLADVAATAGSEDEDEVGRRGDEAAEVRGLPPGRDHQDPAEEQRAQATEHAEHDLQPDGLADLVIGDGGHRASGVERDVRREPRQHAQPQHRIGHRQVLTRRESHRTEGATGEERGTRVGEVDGEAVFLRELRANQRTAGG